MKRIIFALLFTALPSTAFARPTTALTYALIRILKNDKWIERSVCPVVSEVAEKSKPLFIWSDNAFDTDLEGDWSHKITCDVEIPTETNKKAYVTMTSFYTVSDYWGSRTITDEKILASNLSEETLHRHTVEGKNKIVVEMSFTHEPESVK